MKRSGVLLTLAVLLAMPLACVGTTGGAIVDFPAAASGPVDAVVGQPLSFTTDRGWHVVLTRATMHIGAVYLEQSEPVSGSQETGCVLPGTYVAQETNGLDIDLLSPSPQLFPDLGHGTTLPALVGQVWLVDGDINATDSTTPVLVVEGTADQGGIVVPFDGQVTIGTNRGTNRAMTGATPGADPICKQRIVSPIQAPLSVQSAGGLLLRIDPRILFVNVEFETLTSAGGTYHFSDDPSSPAYGQASRNLYLNLHSAGSLYTFSWADDAALGH
jgi:hypothetical protein